MEAAISAIAGDLFGRLISFLINKCTDKATIDEKLERLQQLLLRIHAVVTEADGRYITNPWMLMQLKLLVASMYRGYHILDIFRYKSLVENIAHDEVRSSLHTRLTSSIPLKRVRAITATTRIFSESDDLHHVLENLEAAIANMSEFVLLLVGCESMSRRPFDTYLYIDNFMFGRHIEKQQVITTLLQNPEHHDVLPVIGGYRVGKKALVGHVCNNDRIRSYFASILFINGESICRRIEQAKLSNERTLTIVEFLTDVDDDDWLKFYSNLVATTAKGSKVIIISRIRNLARFGTTKTVFLNSLSHEEFSYLFKKLAFGSTDEKDYPHMVSIANELAILLGGSLIPANVVADLLRTNLNIQFWLRILRRFKGMVDNNLSRYGEHPKNILENERPIDLTSFISSCHGSLRLMPPRVERDKDCPKRKPPNVSLGDLIRGCTIPKGEFMLVAWESRIAPYTKHVCVAACTDDNGCRTSARKRRSII
ncbi:hypothetical protein ACP70R_020715 [Stipagrostis hirtigluma subsp. patula]